MVTIRAFVHDGSSFAIEKALVDDVYHYQAYCDGKPIGETSTASADTVADAKSAGGDLDSMMADELERAIRAVRLEVTRGAPKFGV